MIGLLRPELLLLAIPLSIAWWKTRPADPAAATLRAVVLGLLVLALGVPYLDTTAPGRDVLVLVDRSLSMPPGSEQSALELIGLAEDELGDGDRLGVIGFGADARIEQTPAEQPGFARFELDPGRSGSDLGGALATALHLIPRGRSGRVLIVSDGENNGRDPIPLARRAFARDVTIDVRTTARQGKSDISIDRIDLPESVGEGEPFQFTAWIHSDVDTETEVVLERDGVVLSAGRRVLARGKNRVVFRDIARSHGVAEYRVTIPDAGDRVPENNRAVAATSVIGQPAVLVLNDDGEADALSTALVKAGVPVATARPEVARLDHVGLSRYRAVILENVAADRIGRHLGALAAFVTERGGGLMLTGGRASFGVGGYHRSELDELLPVSMEMRQEQRKLGVGLAMVLDRSGSMGLPVAGNLRKMDLANRGAAAAIELLSPIDAVSVIAVDSEPHVVVGLQPVSDPKPIASRALRIEAGGGGIFVKTGLIAAAKVLDASNHRNRHIILFSDAADSEEQEGCAELVEGLLQAGVTLSVIALGTESDSDAGFLKDIAARGGGSIYFTTSPSELPRLFAQDTLVIARASFVTDPTPTAVLPGLLGLGRDVERTFPAIDGYNLTWLRESATAAVATTDEYHAPVFAYQYQGLGRTAALCAQIGGEYGKALPAWSDFSAFCVTVARWLLGTEEPQDFFTSARREGMDAVLSVEVDPDEAALADTSRLQARVLLPDGGTRDVPLERVSEHRYEARTRLPEAGVALGTIRLGDDRFVSLPPMVLPHSPEFERSADSKRGERLLARVAEEGGGGELSSVAALFHGDTRSKGRQRIGRHLALAALMLLILEIASRRLPLFSWLRLPRRSRRSASVSDAKDGLTTSDSPPAEHVAAEPAKTPDVAQPAASAEPKLESALDRAKRSAKRRLGG